MSIYTLVAPATTPTLLTPAAAADWLAVPEATLANWRHLLVGPAFVRLGPGIGYRLDDLETWLDADADLIAAA